MLGNDLLLLSWRSNAADRAAQEAQAQLRRELAAMRAHRRPGHIRVTLARGAVWVARRLDSEGHGSYHQAR